MKKKNKILLGIFCAGLSLAGVTNAYFSDQIAVWNEIQMGDVDISLREYCLRDGKETAYQSPQAVQPGDKISKIPRITNLAEPCWIRARVNYQNKETTLEGFSDENLSGISSKWVKQGEYFYYTEVVKENEAIDFFHQLQIPEDWDNRYANGQLAVEVHAEAIQAIHFEPDFAAMSPWGNEEIELCIHEEDDRLIEKKEKIRHQIEFQGEAHKLLSVSEDFFSNFGTAMPGDVWIDYADLKNTTKHPAVIYFHTEVPELSKEQKMLLDQLQLELKLGERNLYKGSLSAEKLRNEISLIELKAGEAGKLEFTVRIPKELKNAYALQNTKVKWVFRVEEDETEKTDSPGKPETPGKIYETPETITEKETQTPYTVKTGDLGAYRFLRYVLVLMISGITAAAAFRKGEKR